MPQELFKPYRNYLIGDKGTVKRDDGYIVKPHVTGKDSNYLRVNVRFEKGKPNKMLVHRLVMLAHKPVDGYEDLTVDHKDGNGFNNCISNLRWMASGDNKRRSSQVGGKAYNPSGELIEFKCIAEHCRKYDLHAGNFVQMMKGNPAYTHTKGWTRYVPVQMAKGTS